MCTAIALRAAILAEPPAGDEAVGEPTPRRIKGDSVLIAKEVELAINIGSSSAALEVGVHLAAPDLDVHVVHLVIVLWEIDVDEVANIAEVLVAWDSIAVCTTLLGETLYRWLLVYCIRGLGHVLTYLERQPQCR